MPPRRVIVSNPMADISIDNVKFYRKISPSMYFFPFASNAWEKSDHKKLIDLHFEVIYFSRPIKKYSHPKPKPYDPIIIHSRQNK
jgi:hypothetical protein